MVSSLFKHYHWSCRYLLLIALVTLPYFLKAKADQTFQLKGGLPIYTSARPGEPLYKAVEALQRDIKNILGSKVPILTLQEIKLPGLVILNDADDKLSVTVSGWEAHRMYLKKINDRRQVILEGADMRGAIYAIYTFSEQILKVPPLWYYSSWRAIKSNIVSIPVNLNVTFPSPQVKYRAWFPNDTDLFETWRKLSKENNEIWLETALRLKLNTIEWFDDERDYAKTFSVSVTTKLISDYGLINTTHHHSPLNASLAGWRDYWEKTVGVSAPQLLLTNQKQLEQFWRYNVDCVIKSNIDMLWVIGFRGNGDHPFWYTFKDAPLDMEQRGGVISEMMERQRQIVVEECKNIKPQFRTIFYDELSDLLAEGYINPPQDSSLIRTYVAARRDHYPNTDLQRLIPGQPNKLGYYFNYQFTSTGSHLAAGEGPWKMEENFRYVAGKSKLPLAFSVVNAGNIREFVMELSANAAMMWNFKQFSTNSFLENFCALYYGKENSSAAANLYRKYYNAYWQQRNPTLPDFNRQYIFQDLRYRKAIMDICGKFNKPFDTEPLKDIPAEQEKGRTYRIIPEDNGAKTQIQAIINGTEGSGERFLKVAKAADRLAVKINVNNRVFFKDNIIAPSYYMYYLNSCLSNLCLAYQTTDDSAKKQLIKQSTIALKNAASALKQTAHGNFNHWYDSDRVFDLANAERVLNQLSL